MTSEDSIKIGAITLSVGKNIKNLIREKSNVLIILNIITIILLVFNLIIR